MNKIRIIKVTTKDGDTIYCREDTRIGIEQSGMILNWCYTEMTEDEFNSFPATSASAKLLQ